MYVLVYTVLNGIQKVFKNQQWKYKFMAWKGEADSDCLKVKPAAKVQVATMI
jgi:hypothetical protein